jgi:putative flippase GtrA
MIDNFKSKEFVKFFFAGAFSALVNFSSRFFYNQYLSFSNAVILAYITGMIVAFILFKLFVFNKSKHTIKKEILYFTLVNIIAIIQTYLISIYFAEYLFPSFHFKFYPETIAHTIGIVFPIFTSFIGHKYFSFKSKI